MCQRDGKYERKVKCYSRWLFKANILLIRIPESGNKDNVGEDIICLK